MTDLEDRLRADLATRARQADPGLIRPLREPAARARLRVPRWLAPVAAAAAVTAVIIGAGFAGQLPGHGPVAAPVAGLPGHYLTVDQPGPGNVARAVVRSSATGKALATVRIPMVGSESPSVAAAADGRTYVVVDDSFQSAGHGYSVRIYRLRVGPGGRTIRVDRLPIKTFPLAVDAVALSPDGGKLAIAEQSCRHGGCQYSQVQVRLLTGSTAGADRTVQTWRTRASGLPLSLSWSADGSQIGFLWESGLHSPPHRQRDGYRLLAVAAPGVAAPPVSALLAAGPVVQVAPNPGHDIPAAFVTMDGQALVTSSTRVIRGQGNHDTVITRVVELPVGGGQAQRVLYQATGRGVPQADGQAGGDVASEGCRVLSLDTSARHPLVQCFLFGQFRFGVLAGGQLRPLPGVPNSYCTQRCREPMSGTATW
jgi:hypothetical protein